MMRILLTAPQGQVGWELRRTLAPLGEVIALGRSQLDLANPAQAAQAVRELSPQVIVNAAAYTAVDRAEAEEALARAVNALAPGAMAAAAAEVGALFVHYSTDYVFDGCAVRPYRESDAVHPVSAYGRTKEEGERRVRDSGARHLILRTAWVYGPRGRNFMRTMLKLAAERDRLRVVSDQIGSPTSSRLIAEATALLIARAHADQALRATLHLTCGGAVSWHGFAQRIVETGAQIGLCPPRPVDAIASSEYPTPAHRPAYSVLDNTGLRERFGIGLPHWNDALQLCLAELAGQ